MTVARSPAQVIAGEAVSGSLQDRWNDMLNIASTMYNRSMMTGVPISDISSVTSQYNAYGHPLPPGTSNYVDMAQQALDYVAANGPVNNASFYATPAALNNLPPGLEQVTSTTGHVYFSDPQFRSIITAQGIKTPDPSQLGGMVVPGAAIPEARPTTALNNFADLASAPTPSYPDLSKTGMLGALFSSTPAPQVDANASGLLGTNNFDASAKVGPSLLSNSGWQTMANPGAPLDMSGWQQMAASGPMGGYPASPMDRMGPLNPNDFQAMAFTGPMKAPISSPTVSSWNAMAAAGPMGGYPADPLSAARMGVPSLDTFAPMSFAAPVQAPMDASATAAQPTNPALAAQTSVAGGLLSGPALTPSLNSFAPVAAATPVSAPMNVTAAAPSMATTPGLSANAGLGISVTPADSNQIANRFAPSIDPYSNTQAFTDIPSTTPASANVATAAAPTISGLLGGPATTAGNMSMLNQAMNPVSSLQTGIPQEPGVTGLNLGVQDPTYQNIVNASFPASIPSIEAASNLPSVTPSAVDANSSTVPGPATTSATQQQTQAKQPTSAKSALSGIFNGPTMVGGLLGALAGGPVGGLLGGLVGNRINANGGLSGMLGSHPMSINNIGGGLANVAGVYGGAPLGTQANTNNGGTVTSLGGGWTAYTNPYGVTSVEGPNMEHAADWSGMFGGTSHGPVGNGQPGGGGATGGSGLF